jgi:hypothetical protein
MVELWLPADPDHLRVEEFLRTGRIHVGLGDDGCTSIDIGGHLVALRGGQRDLDAIVTRTERVLYKTGPA